MALGKRRRFEIFFGRNPKPVGESLDMIHLEPVTKTYIETIMASNFPPIYTLSPAAARQALDDAQTPVAKPAAIVEDAVFPVGPTGSVRVRIVRPESAQDPLPVVMHFHGGGWILGDKETHDLLTREIAVGANAAVVFVDYERSPEARFPTAIEQAYAATCHVVEQAKKLKVDASRLAVLGDSAGGNIAAAVTLMAKERKGPKIGLQVLFYPVTDANLETGSYQEFKDGPWLTKNAMEWFWNAYLPDVAARKNPLATPLNASLDQLRDLPEALIVVAENDVLRDEGEAYARKLSEAGVRVTSLRCNGTIHDFVLLHALKDTPAARSALTQATELLKSKL
jgi:acetyl esterase